MPRAEEKLERSLASKNVVAFCVVTLPLGGSVYLGDKEDTEAAGSFIMSYVEG